MGRVTEFARQIRWYWGTLMGDNHYRRYVEHRGRTPSRRAGLLRTRVLADAPRRHRGEPQAPLLLRPGRRRLRPRRPSLLLRARTCDHARRSMCLSCGKKTAVRYSGHRSARFKRRRHVVEHLPQDFSRGDRYCPPAVSPPRSQLSEGLRQNQRASQNVNTPLSFADLGVPAPLVAALAAAGNNDPFPIQTDTLPDTLAGRDVLGRGKTGSRQDPRLRPPDGRAPRQRARRRQPPPGPPARPRARPDPRARHPDHRRASSRSPTAYGLNVDHHLRRRLAEPPGRRAQGRRRHRRRLPRPPRRPDEAGLRHASTPSRSPCSTRPTTWPTSASCPASPASSTATPAERPAPAVLAPRSTTAWTSSSSGSCTTRCCTRSTRPTRPSPR